MHPKYTKYACKKKTRKTNNSVTGYFVSDTYVFITVFPTSDFHKLLSCFVVRKILGYSYSCGNT